MILAMMSWPRDGVCGVGEAGAAKVQLVVGVHDDLKIWLLPSMKLGPKRWLMLKGRASPAG